MRVLVTGGRGFIGSEIVAGLLAAGDEVRVLDLRSGGSVTGVEYLRGDIRDADTVAAALRGVDAVCHQAAMVGLSQLTDDMPDYVAHNSLGTAVVLAEMARAGLTELVVASSMVVYGEGAYQCPTHGSVRPGPRRADDLTAGVFEPCCPLCDARLAPYEISEDFPCDPRNTYATTKMSQEHLTASWAHTVGGHVAALRYHNVYGPGMPRDTPYAGVASFFKSALAAGRAPRVFEDGGQLRDFVHVRDVAAANVSALRSVHERRGSGAFFRPYNVASGEPHTVGEMATELAAAHGGPEPVVTGQYRIGDVRHVFASRTRLERELGWRAQVGFAEGMKEFAAAPLRAASGVVF